MKQLLLVVSRALEKISNRYCGIPEEGPSKAKQCSTDIQLIQDILNKIEQHNSIFSNEIKKGFIDQSKLLKNVQKSLGSPSSNRPKSHAGHWITKKGEHELLVSKDDFSEMEGKLISAFLDNTNKILEELDKRSGVGSEILNSVEDLKLLISKK